MPDFINQPFSGDAAHVPGQRPAEVIRVSSPASLLAAVPVLLKFEPSEPTMVVIGTVPPRSSVAVALRYDIGNPRRATALARHAASLLGAQGITSACAVGYGPDEVVTPVADALRAHFIKSEIAVPELLRAQDGRYWSYVCNDPECCPSDGTSYDPKDHPVARKYADWVLASRDALAATVAPVTGEAADSMRKATRAARQRASRVAARAGKSDRDRRRARREAGLQAVADAVSLYRSGGRLESHKDAAWLALSLESLQVRDDAWSRMVPEHRQAHLRLWTDLTTLAQPGYVDAPASLLAFCAWQDGDGALANVALDRALADNPDYSMAVLIRDALDCGAPPSMARLPMSPEDVAASYQAAEEAQEAAENPSSESPADGNNPHDETAYTGPGVENASAAGLADVPA
jgi:hypothetical protein